MKQKVEEESFEVASRLYSRMIQTWNEKKGRRQKNEVHKKQTKMTGSVKVQRKVKEKLREESAKEGAVSQKDCWKVQLLNRADGESSMGQKQRKQLMRMMKSPKKQSWKE